MSVSRIGQKKSTLQPDACQAVGLRHLWIHPSRLQSSICGWSPLPRAGSFQKHPPSSGKFHWSIDGETRAAVVTQKLACSHLHVLSQYEYFQSFSAHVAATA